MLSKLLGKRSGAGHLTVDIRQVFKIRPSDFGSDELWLHMREPLDTPEGSRMAIVVRIALRNATDLPVYLSEFWVHLFFEPYEQPHRPARKLLADLPNAISISFPTGVSSSYTLPGDLYLRFRAHGNRGSAGRDRPAPRLAQTLRVAALLA